MKTISISQWVTTAVNPLVRGVRPGHSIFRPASITAFPA